MSASAPSLQNYRHFYDDSPLGVFHADCGGTVHYANASCRDIAGLDGPSIAADGWLRRIHPDDRERAASAWRDACTSRASLDLACRIVRPDGTRRYVRLLGRPCPADVALEDCYMAVVMDLTDQVVAERRLRNNNVLLQAILANIPCGLTVFAPDGSLVLDNQRFEPGPELASDFGALGGSPQAAALTAYPDTGPEATVTGADLEPRIREEVQPDGRVLEVREAPMPMGGMVTTFTDITSHKQSIETLQQAKQAAEQGAAAKAAFLATMSHEIRTPMNGVIGMTNVLLETQLTHDQRELVEVIRQSGESLLVVINDVLDYSKIESGLMELEWLPFRVADVVRNSVRLVEAKARERSVAIGVAIAQDIPGLILGDRTRLQQVIVNLLSNAVKFTEQGEIRVIVSNLARGSNRHSGDAAGDMCTLQVVVEDTGIGIAADKLPSLFEPFVQADSSTSRRYGGTGLGLAIARKLVEAMGGSIRLESERGVGTTASFTFLAETAIPRSRDAGLAAPLWRKRVLVLGGPRADLGPLIAQMKRWGMAHEACRSASEAASLLKGDDAFDLLVAAGHGIDAAGADLVRILRNAGVAVPIVILSRRKRSEAVDRAQRVWVLSRTTSEASLYDALVAAIQSSGTAAAMGPDTLSQFDDTLAARMPLDIVVAEDNEINRKVALRTLAAFGYEADVAHNGLELVELVRKRPYDLVLMDVQMPHMDGIEATRFVAGKLRRRSRPRIVVMSANVMQEHVDAALAAGADGFIAKPFAPAELRAVLQKAAESRRSPGDAPSAASANAPALVDPARVRAHLVGAPSGAFLLELIESFEQSAPELLARMRAAVANADVESLRAAVHEYSGVCAVMGAERLMRCLLEIQELARGANLDRLPALLDECATLEARTGQALRAALDENRFR